MTKDNEMTHGRFHVNPETGKVSRCSTTAGRCRFRNNDGSEAEHFQNLHEARRYAESMLSQRYGALASRSAVRHRKLRTGVKLLALSGALVTSFSTVGCSNLQPAFSSPPSDSASSSSDPSRSPQTPAQGPSTPSASSSTDRTVPSLQGAEKKVQKGMRNLRKAAESDGTSDGTSDSGSGSTILFQGRSLTPTKAEVSRAETQLASLIEVPESQAGTYNRASQFGYFRSGVVGTLEHRDINSGIFQNSSSSSRAVGGSFIDPYTGKTVDIVKGSRTDTDVDHVVPLKEVYQSENPYSPLTEAQRHQIANDPRNLQVVSSAVNRSKGDGDEAEFLPTYEPSQCVYSITVITVKSSYHLTVDNAEHQALRNVLRTKCRTSD